MNNSDIQTFLTLVNTKNITRTAQTLFISQPTVSRRLKQLETELGYTLMIRDKGGKQITLTPAGEAFVPLAEQLTNLWNRMRQIGDGGWKSSLAVGCTDTFNAAILLPFYVSLWTERRNNLSLKIATHYSHHLYEMLEIQEINLGFAFHYLDFKNITAEPLLNEAMFLVQPDAPDTLRREIIHTDELDPDNEIFVSWETQYEIWHNQWILRDHQPGLTVDTYLLLRELLQVNHSWAIAPFSVVRQLHKDTRIYVSRIKNDVLPPRRMTYLLGNKNESATISRVTNLFIRHLREFLQIQYDDVPESVHIYEP